MAVSEVPALIFVVLHPFVIMIIMVLFMFCWKPVGLSMIVRLFYIIFFSLNNDAIFSSGCYFSVGGWDGSVTVCSESELYFFWNLSKINIFFCYSWFYWNIYIYLVWHLLMFMNALTKYNYHTHLKLTVWLIEFSAHLDQWYLLWSSYSFFQEYYLVYNELWNNSHSS